MDVHSAADSSAEVKEEEEEEPSLLSQVDMSAVEDDGNEEEFDPSSNLCKTNGSAEAELKSEIKIIEVKGAAADKPNLPGHKSTTTTTTKESDEIKPDSVNMDDAIEYMVSNSIDPFGLPDTDLLQDLAVITD